MNQLLKTSEKERLNVILPNDTLRLINKLTAKGQRSQFINKAVRFYVENLSKKNIKKQIEEGAKKRAKRDLDLMEEWFALDNEIG